MLIVRFDLRAPGASGAERAALHRTAVDMARYVDEVGNASLVVSEHHASEDGYLPAPFSLAAAMAAVTTRTPIVVALTILPLHDPVRLAEDIVTLDLLSGGRAMVVMGLGYRRVEYDLFGVDYRRRGAIADQKLTRLLELLDNAGVFDRPGSVPVSPAPLSEPRRILAWGGGSTAAAERAGRHGIGLFAQTDAPRLRTAYAEAARAAGFEPGLCVLPSPDAPYAVFVDENVDRGWEEVGGSLLADAVAYHRWNVEGGTPEGTASLSSAATVDELRAAEGAHRVVDTAGARRLIDRYGVLAVHPLCGGLDPAVAWPYLRRAAEITR